MSQTYKNMNSNGKFILIGGSILSLFGLFFLLFEKVSDSIILGTASLVVGLYYLGWSQWDARFNINYKGSVKEDVLKNV